MNEQEYKVLLSMEVRITQLEEGLETVKNKNWIAMFLLADAQSELSETRWLLRMVVSDLYGIEAETIDETKDLLVEHIIERDGLFK